MRLKLNENSAQENDMIDSFENDQVNSCSNDSNRRKYKSKWDAQKKLEFRNSFNGDNITRIITSINSLKDKNQVSQNDIDRLTKEINNVYQEAGNSAGVIKILGNVKFHLNKWKKKSTNQPWFTKTCNLNRKLLYGAKHKCRRIRSVANKNRLKVCSKKYKTEMREARKTFNKEIHKKLRSIKSSNPKDYWAIINNDDKKVASRIKTEILFEHFKKLNQITNNDKTSDNTTNSNDNDSFSINDENPFNLPFTDEEITKSSVKLRNGKASGLDALINEFIKNSPPNMLSLITSYFNLILDTAVVPTDWTLGLMVSIYKKKGDKMDPDNYRGITLLSCMGKLFSMLLNSRLSLFLENNNLLGEEQTGFRSQYSTLDHIFTLYCIIDLYKSKKRRLYAAFVDYRKAFDTVDRHHLWHKLINLNIKGKILKVIQSMYNNAKTCVQNGNDVSDFFECNIGVRQGENLSPLLFSIFLNDLSEFLSKDSVGIQIEFDVDRLTCYIKLFALLYADDTILLSNSPKDLQLMLNSLNCYCNMWNLKVNTKKTKIVIFSRGLVRKTPDFYYGSEKIEIVSDYVYLGVTFNFNGKFPKAINKQILQAKQALFSISAKGRRFQLPLDIQLHLFDACILPILLYGSEVWGFADTKSLEVFHNQYCKYILRLGSNTINNLVLGELGRYKIEKFVKQRMLNFWLKMVTGKTNKISFLIYQKMKDLYDKNEHHSAWLNAIKTTLDQLQLGHLWDTDPVYLNPNSLKTVFDKKLSMYYREQWADSVVESSACDTYVKFKDSLKFEPYLILLEPKLAIPITKFRTNNHRLPIVAGRYANIPREERICKLCNLNVIGDEYHYLLICNHFAAERNQFIDCSYTSNPNISNMKRLLNSNDINVLNRLSKFISIIMNHFKKD